MYSEDPGFRFHSMFGVPGKGNSGVLTSSECETVNILISVNDVITTLLVSVTIIINVSLFFFDLTFFCFLCLQNAT